jgi:hypothetical protein
MVELARQVLHRRRIFRCGVQAGWWRGREQAWRSSAFRITPADGPVGWLWLRRSCVSTAWSSRCRPGGSRMEVTSRSGLSPRGRSFLVSESTVSVRPFMVRWQSEQRRDVAAAGRSWPSRRGRESASSGPSAGQGDDDAPQQPVCTRRLTSLLTRYPLASLGQPGLRLQQGPGWDPHDRYHEFLTAAREELGLPPRPKLKKFTWPKDDTPEAQKGDSPTSTGGSGAETARRAVVANRPERWTGRRESV